MGNRALILLLIALASGPALADPWGDSIDAASGSRFIPVELWTGNPWDGARSLALPDANFAFGGQSQKIIRGPTSFTRPGGEVVQVYERENRGKRQLFTLTSRRDGLGRVYDSRYGRDCTDEVKFPLGTWKQGETRVFEVSCNGGKLTRRIELTIEQVDFEYGGVKHSLKYRWLVDGGRGPDTDMRYVYSPGRGMVDVR